MAVRSYARWFGSYSGEVVRRAHGGTWGVVRIYSDSVVAVQVEDGQNEELLDLSHQILELTKQVHAITVALPGITPPRNDPDSPS